MPFFRPSATLLVALAAFSSVARAAEPPAPPADTAWEKTLASYDVAWTTPSEAAPNSMPLSGHNLGINAWVERGDLMLLLGSPNCMDENGMQVKLGLIRLRFDHPVFAKGFKQTLRLAQSEIVVEGQTEGGTPVAVKLWGEVGKPVVHARLASGNPVGLTASYETWSTYQAQVKDGGIQWMRRLPEENPRRLRDMKAQGMAEFADQIPDPLSKLTCGGRLDAPGLVDAGAAAGKLSGLPTQGVAVKTQEPVKALDLTLTLRMEQDASIQAWETGLAAEARKAQGDLEKKRADALAWWKAFWDRSHVVIAPTSGTLPEKDKPWQAARNYQLVRYMLAANPSGRGMTLFNGGMFTCQGNPDVRMWEGCQFMAQNQRLIHWPMLKSGDFDLLKVALDFYRDRTGMSKAHAKKFWGVEGVAWPEAFSIFGLDSIGTNADGRCRAGHLSYHHTTGMEFALMMLEMGRYTGEELPGYREPAEGILRYYDQFYQKKNGLGKDGKLVIHPSDANETYHGCRNNTDVIAGLTALTRGLLAMPSLPAAERAYVEGFKERIPAFPIREHDGRKYYAAAESWENVFQNGNMEFPQMYVCFPFTIAALGRPEIKLAEATWDLDATLPNARVQKHQNKCWYQSSINLARLGRTMEAAHLTLDKLLHPSARFPVFYANGGFDQMPDTDHGGSAMIALQEMLMQTDGDRILLGPAWPGNWDCGFKLHAPRQTIIEGRVADGKVVVDKVTPEARRKDIEIFPLKAPPPPPVSQGKPAKTSSIHGGAYDGAKAVDGDEATRWGSTRAATSSWLEVDLGKPTAVSRAVMMEKSYAHTREFAVEALEADGAWKTLAEGKEIGDHKEVVFPKHTARKFRLNLRKTEGPANLEEFQLFGK